MKKDHKEIKQTLVSLDEYGRVLIEDENLLQQIKGGSDLLDGFEDQFSNGACANVSCS